MIDKTKVCLLPKGISGWDLTNEEILSKYLLFETSEKIEISIPFRYKGKCYSSGWTKPKEKIAIVREFTENSGVDVEYESEITCPFCGDTNNDSCEVGESEEKEICSTCGSEFSWEREVEITYSSTPVKKFEIKTIED